MGRRTGGHVDSGSRKRRGLLVLGAGMCACAVLPFILDPARTGRVESSAAGACWHLSGLHVRCMYARQGSGQEQYHGHHVGLSKNTTDLGAEMSQLATAGVVCVWPDCSGGGLACPELQAVPYVRPGRRAAR